MTIQLATPVPRANAHLRAGHPAARSRRKRALDLVAATAALLLFLPLLILIAIAIVVEGDGPVLFRQQRGGLGGRPFEIYKFRTMWVCEDGDEIRQAERRDGRVTRVGAVLRRLSLDELPQLVNVLRGDMSLVGPRPHALAHDRLWMACMPEYLERFRVRPGLTGQAQVLGHRGQIESDAALAARIAADNAYIDGWTFWKDVDLLLRTVPLICGDRAAF